jgi:hypothetical protein
MTRSYRDAGELTEGAAATQWDATRDVPWEEAGPLQDFLEMAVCQVVTRHLSDLHTPNLM